MDASLSDDSDFSLLNITPDTNTELADNLTDQMDIQTELSHYLSYLSEKKAEILKLFWGIGIDFPMSLEDIGLRYDITKERVRQIKDKALLDLQQVYREKNASKSRSTKGASKSIIDKDSTFTQTRYPFQQALVARSKDILRKDNFIEALKKKEFVPSESTIPENANKRKVIEKELIRFLEIEESAKKDPAISLSTVTYLTTYICHYYLNMDRSTIQNIFGFSTSLQITYAIQQVKTDYYWVIAKLDPWLATNKLIYRAQRTPNAT